MPANLICSFTSRVRGQLRRMLGYPFLRNVNGWKGEGAPRRCLMVYLALPFTRSPTHPSFLSHQNLGQSKLMAKAFGDAGFVVDVADFRDPRIPVSTWVYDVIITHHPSLEVISHVVGPSTQVVYLATGMCHAEQNRRLQIRLDALERRRGFRIPMFVKNDEQMTVMKRADAIVAFGTPDTMGIWEREYMVPVHYFNNSGFDWIRPAESMHMDCTRHFLFFGGVNQVLKGLDLVLEAFSVRPNLHLHVAGYYDQEPEFCACYEHEMLHLPNIHMHGVVVIGSAKWNSLISQCAFMVLPSCSESQVGSVIQGMFAGMVPVVTSAAGIDVRSCGFELPDDVEAGLGSMLDRLSELPDFEWVARREKVLMTAKNCYSQKVFFDRWRAISKGFAEKQAVNADGIM